MHDDFPLPDLEWEPTRPFWDGAARQELALPHCSACGALVWYPRPHCDDGELVWAPISGRGVLVAWTVVRHAFLPQFREVVPYVPALVAVDEDRSVRVVTRMVDCAPADLRADMAVTVVFGELAFPGIDCTVAAPFFTPIRP